MRKRRLRRVVKITVLAVISISVILLYKFYEFPIKEGTIIKLEYDIEHLSYREVKDSIYRKVAYKTTKTYTKSDGTKGEKTVTKYKKVFDHYEYAVYEYLDGEDYVVYISTPSKKVDGKLLYNEFYVTASRFENLTIGDTFVFDSKELKDQKDESNNSETRKTEWIRSHHNMNKWTELEY